ncbi:MAG: High-affinity zinc uptake system membrane protein ZnuB [Phycisphaerae bacterium]|nr:High-affinity zinc uptake system membrane protein ZnuB [Phycisphaerae bacterium]
MSDFFRDMAVNPMLLTGLLAGLLASVACGVIGPYVITRRVVFLAGAIAHTAVGGIGAAIFLSYRWPGAFGWLTPPVGATIVAVASALLLGVMHDRVAERMDTLVGAMWAVGMAAGVMLIKFTPGYHTELMSYLFGSIATVASSDVWLIAALDAVIVAAVLLTHKRLLAICLDEEQAGLQGVSVLGTNLLLLTLVALTVICLIQVVGLILVLALLTLPAAAASHHVRRLAPIIWISVGLCMVLTTGPRVAVYGTRLSPESAIVLAAAGLYLLSLLLTRLRARPGGR